MSKASMSMQMVRATIEQISDGNVFRTFTHWVARRDADYWLERQARAYHPAATRITIDGKFAWGVKRFDAPVEC